MSLKTFKIRTNCVRLYEYTVWDTKSLINYNFLCAKQCLQTVQQSLSKLLNIFKLIPLQQIRTLFAEDDEATWGVCPGPFLRFGSQLVVGRPSGRACTTAPSMGERGDRARGEAGLTGTVEVVGVGVLGPGLLHPV